MDEFDFGDMSGLDFGDFDLSGLENMDLSGLEGLDLSGLEGLNLSGLEGMDLSGLEGLQGLTDVDMSGLSFEGLDPSMLESLGLKLPDSGGDSGGSDDEDFGGGADGGLGGFSLDESFDDMDQRIGQKYLGVGEFFDSGEPLRTPQGVDESFAKDLSDTDYERYIESLSPESQAEQERLQKIAENLNLRPGDEGVNMGKMPSGWQKSSDGSYVNIRDDGTADGIDQDGNSFALSESQVQSRIKSGDLNTFKSGYNTATGGNKIAPGGGTPVTLKNGKEGQLMPNGKVIDKDSGKVIGTDKDVKTDSKTANPTGNKTGEKKDDWMKYIMLLMALDAMRNKGGGSSGAVVPSLTAGRSATPYAEIQNAPGYRPGQGGVQYFGPKVYRAAGGGIGSLDAAGGRLLRGPGDGVSDDIVAQIGDRQPARLADGEYVLDARTVSEIGNGSTDAGADKIAQMVERVHNERRQAKRGEPSNADKKLLA
jgi:hypothetical protein